MWSVKPFKVSLFDLISRVISGEGLSYGGEGGETRYMDLHRSRLQAKMIVTIIIRQQIVLLICLSCITMTIKIVLPVDLEQLISAIESGNVRNVTTALQNDIPKEYLNKLDPVHGSALIRAIKKGSTAIVDELLKNENIDVNKADGNEVTPLIHAITLNAVEIVNALLAKGARGNTKALCWAISNAHSDFVETLLGSKSVGVGASDCDNKFTPLTEAAKSGNMAFISRLLGRGAEINSDDGNGNTALHVAVNETNVELVRGLMDVEGIKINTVDREGKTALELATEKKKSAEHDNDTKEKYGEIIEVLRQRSTAMKYSINVIS